MLSEAVEQKLQQGTRMLYSKQYEMRLSLMIAWGMCSCVIAEQFCQHGFALPSFVTFPLVYPLPSASWFIVGPCVQVSTLILHWKFSVTGARGEVTLRRLLWLPTFIAFCPHWLACFLVIAVNWHLPSIFNIAYRQVIPCLNKSL